MNARRALVIAAIAVACVVVWQQFASYPIVNRHPTGTNIVAFGDSLTFGTGASRGNDYPSQLEKLAGMKILNAGVPGDTSGDALARLSKDVLDRDPKVVIVLLGGNDLLQRVSPATTFENLRQIVDKVQQKGAMVALVGVQNPIWGGEYKSGFRKLAKEKGAVLIPNVLSGIIDHAALKSDQVHPNDKGYALIAERIYKGLHPYLND